ncbi:hypothetical protein LEMLEM_LOCUS16058 [Lemmus lemmus]
MPPYSCVLRSSDTLHLGMKQKKARVRAENWSIDNIRSEC